MTHKTRVVKEIEIQFTKMSKLPVKGSKTSEKEIEVHHLLSLKYLKDNEGEEFFSINASKDYEDIYHFKINDPSEVKKVREFFTEVLSDRLSFD